MTLWHDLARILPLQMVGASGGDPVTLVIVALMLIAVATSRPCCRRGASSALIRLPC